METKTNFTVVDYANGTPATNHETLDAATETARALGTEGWYIEDWTGEIVWTAENEFH